MAVGGIRGGRLGYGAAPSFAYIPALDGMRALSVLLVMFSHIGFKTLLPGGFGVTAFFFISGFLITRQLLAEQEASGQLNLPAFYMRRLLRLYPALLVAVGVGGALFIALGGHLPMGQVFAAVFYYTNYYARVSPYVGVPDGMFDPFAILWSLAVEEHYYLVFPGLVFLLGRARPRFALALCAAIAAMTAWRLHVAAGCATAGCLGDGVDDRILQATDTRIDSILYGAVLATLLGTRGAGALLRLLQGWAAFAAGLGLIGASLLVRDPFFRDGLRFSVQGIGLALAGGAALFSAELGWVRALLTRRPMLLVGRWSYSLYLWHPLVLLCAAAALPEAVWRPAVEGGRLSLLWDLVGVPAVAAVAIGVAALSYTCVERPVVALRRRFGSHAVRDGAPLAAITLLDAGPRRPDAVPG